MVRREFNRATRVEIVRRATRSISETLFAVFCEKCGALSQRWEIHHLREDALEIDKGGPLTADDGALWCVPCHKEHTASVSIPAVARAKRREAAHIGAEKPNKAAIPQRPKPSKPPSKAPVPGLPRLAREGFVAAGRARSE